MTAIGLSPSEIGVSLFIIAAVLWAALRTGQNNPVGTGQLARKVEDLSTTVTRQGALLEEQGRQLVGLDRAVQDMTDSSVTANQHLAALRIEMASDRGLTERTWESVDRLQQFFIQEAFDRRRGG